MMLKRTLVLASFAAMVGIAVFSPSVLGLWQWMANRHSSFGQNRIDLPFMWSAQANETGRSRASWIRPHPTLYSVFDDTVTLAGPYKSIDMNTRRKLYGALDVEDMRSNAGFSALASEGIECGKLRRAPANNGQVAVGCISASHQTTLEYSGDYHALSAGLKIMEQALK